MLQRLPGLGGLDQQDGSRYFIDNNFADVAKAGEVHRFIKDCHNYELNYDPKKWKESIGDISTQVLAIKVKGIANGAIEASMKLAKQQNNEVLASDIILCLNYLESKWSREKFIIRDVIIPYFEMKHIDGWANIKFEDVMVRKINIEELSDYKRLPIFESSLFGYAGGLHSVKDVPENIFIDCIFDTFEDKVETNSGLLELELPMSTKVALTILRKLYLQTGGGRKENAFYRGLNNIGQQYVSEVLRLLKQHGLATESSSNSGVWLAVRSQGNRVRNILRNRNIDDEFIKQVKKIK